jgi:SAM-dependent methyltransferase
MLIFSSRRSAWFGEFWAWAGPLVREGGEANVVPLLEGRVQGGCILEEPPRQGAGVGGTVIEIGPGSGQWVSLFSDRYLVSPPAKDSTSTGTDKVQGEVRSRGEVAGRRKVTRVFGIEPNAGVHGLLKEKIAAAGLQDVYEIVPVGIEALESARRVEKESVDCIVSILCLCSIPSPQRNMKELYGYLKPGGRWFVYEHVKCSAKGGRLMGYYQGMSMFWALSFPLIMTCPPPPQTPYLRGLVSHVPAFLEIC